MRTKYNDSHEEEFEKEVNEIAEKYYELKLANKSYAMEQSRLFEKLNEYAEFFSKSYNGVKGLTQDELLSYAYKTIAERLKKWTPNEYGFFKSLKNMLFLRLDDARKEKLDPLERSAYEKRQKKLRDQPELSEEEKAKVITEFKRDDSFNEPDEDGNVSQLSSDEDIEKAAAEKDEFKNIFNVMTEVVLTKKKSYENKKTLCYAMLFYSELVTREVHEGKYPAVLLPIEKRIMKAVDHDFISYYMNGKNNSLYDISKGELKPLSCFTNNSKDDKPCGYPINRKLVIVKYVALVYEEVTDSNINDQQKRFYEKILKEVTKALN